MARPLTRRETRILVIGLILAFTYTGYNFVYKPSQEKLKELEEKIYDVQIKNKKNSSKINFVKNQTDSYSEYLQKFVQSGTNEQIMSSMIAEIEQAANNLNLTISDLKSQRARNTDYYSIFSISLTINSTFTEIIEFLYTLQSEPHLFSIQEARFDKSTRRNSNDIKTILVLNKVLIPQ